MNWQQTLSGWAVVLTMLLALSVRGRGREDVTAACVAVAASWMLCLWAYTDHSPAILIHDATGISLWPRKIWAVQDAAFSCLLARCWMARRHHVTELVGAIFAAQVLLHIGRSSGLIEASYMPALNALFYLQLAVIALEGGTHLGQRIRDWIGSGRASGLGRRAGWLASLKTQILRRRGDMAGGGRRNVLPFEQRGGRG